MATEGPTTVLQTVAVKKSYTMGEIQVEALRGVDLKVSEGDFVAILGPSGCGKSTLLNLIGALDVPTSGKILIDGVDASTLSESQRAEVRGRIGFVFQFFNLIHRFDAIGNVELGMAIAGVPKRDRRQRAEELLKTVGLGDRMHHRPAELSGGQQQRVAIARALANRPRYLLMDEPTGNMDSKNAADIIELIMRINAEAKMTIIMVTHDQTLTAQVSRTIRMLDGLVVGEEAKA
ncbi:MAG: ABC transporter ATP-binding protein [Methanomassiliicoccales archaeon]|nr:ABC transporter ATP-binding protein [Methanomassiliicoccales archaeon]